MTEDESPPGAPRPTPHPSAADTGDSAAEFSIPANGAELMSLLFDPDIVQARNAALGRINAVPDGNLMFPQFERAVARTVVTVEAINVQAERNRARSRSIQR